MINFEFVVLYVEDIAASKKFYSELLGRKPLELSPTFARFPSETGAILELCERRSVLPPSSVSGGGAELCLRLADSASVLSLFEEWKRMGLKFAQEPTPMVFGLTFVALDPDAHRIRVFAAGQAGHGM